MTSLQIFCFNKILYLIDKKHLLFIVCTDSTGYSCFGSNIWTSYNCSIWKTRQWFFLHNNMLCWTWLDDPLFRIGRTASFSITVQLATCTRMYFVPAIMNSVYLHRSWWCPYLHLTACGVNTIAYKNQLLIDLKWKSKDVKLRLMQNRIKNCHCNCF